MSSLSEVFAQDVVAAFPCKGAGLSRRVFEVFGGGTQWYEDVNGFPLPQWNTNCGFGCNPAGTIPADIPLKPQ